MSATHSIVLIVLVLAWLGAWIAAVRSIASAATPLTPAARGGWIAAAIILPALGTILWFTVGRHSLAQG